jgi:AmiR/NasT family two-component response regulator
MERHGLDPQDAFDRMRGEARRTQRPLIELVDEILGSGPPSLP